MDLVGCSPPVQIDPRTHLNGPFVSLRKVQKHQETGRLQSLEVGFLKLPNNLLFNTGAIVVFVQ